eukprot:CAMPEP_0175887542 /NCGR_PEP_ID=MMETSP0107_2-20121207/46220_1 /TAXON_ID=195067 ORGANISM="Goniomonas pacifica, Strain CCMP1869" /NCGR_SAMPLE_ID=MMETSP0107_2 /ASSEMBLY_ACC=CAM_ASM_000203 /LENGTH=131 /DNA_ID=CAMNT_0017207987 /DNA_START=165 /DNA_END=557 /DNA_ORIENTATION=-
MVCSSNSSTSSDDSASLNVNWFRRFHAMACLALPFFAEIASVDDEPAADFKFDPIELKTVQRPVLVGLQLDGVELEVCGGLVVDGGDLGKEGKRQTSHGVKPSEPIHVERVVEQLEKLCTLFVGKLCDTGR